MSLSPREKAITVGNKVMLWGTQAAKETLFMSRVLIKGDTFFLYWVSCKKEQLKGGLFSGILWVCGAQNLRVLRWAWFYCGDEVTAGNIFYLLDVTKNLTPLTKILKAEVQG